MDIDLELFCVKASQREVRQLVANTALVRQTRSRPPSRRAAGGGGLRHALRAWGSWARVLLHQPRPVTK